MNGVKECYGEQYHRNRGECKKCPELIRSYCKDAKTELSRGRHDIKYAADAIEPSCETTVYDEEASDNDLPTIISALIKAIGDDTDRAAGMLAFCKRLGDMAANEPKTYAVAREKLLNPSHSFSDIGRELGYSKQVVAFHLKKAARLIPEMERAFIIDQTHKREDRRRVHTKFLSRTQGIVTTRREIGMQVTAARQRKGISQRKLAVLVSVHYTSIARIETGRLKPSERLLRNIKNVLEI